MNHPVSTALFDQFARGWRGATLVALIALAASQFGAARTPVWDLAEASFAQTSRQMLEAGEFAAGPIWGAHLAQAAAAHFGGGPSERIWFYRLTSALGLVLAALATLWAGAPLVGRRAAFLGASLFAAGMLVGFESAIATADTLAMGFGTLAMAALARLYGSSANPRVHAAIFWLAIIGGVLIAGAAPLIIASAALLVLGLWERRGRWMAPLLWPPLALAVLTALSWAAANALSAHAVVPSQTAPGLPAPPSYHLFLLSFLLFPASYALPAAARLAFGALRGAPSDNELGGSRFLLVWVAPLFMVAELTPAKLPQDAMASYPAIALMCGAGLMAMRGRRWRTTHPLGVALFAVSGAALAAIMALAAMLMSGGFEADVRRAVAAGAIGAVIVGAACVGLLMLRRPAARAAVLIVCALALSFSLRDRLIPDVRGFFVSSEATTALTRARLLPNETRKLWVIGHEPAGIVFLTRGSTLEASPSEVGAEARAGDAILVEGRVREQTLAELASHGLDFVEAAPAVRGHSFVRDRRVSLYVGEVRAAPDQRP
ncbi:MAG: hypothetical protein ABL883_06195 [Terricaulis sp.]